MSEFESRPEHSLGHRKWLWRYDGHKFNWRLDVRDGARQDRRHSDLDDSRLCHYMRMGAIRSDIEEEKERSLTPDRRGAVIFWLSALAVFWIVFQFVRL